MGISDAKRPAIDAEFELAFSKIHAAEGWRYADELEIERKRLTARVEELEAKLFRCGQENCMGWRDEDVASWVREERFLDSQKRVEELEALVREARCFGVIANGAVDAEWHKKAFQLLGENDGR